MINETLERYKYSKIGVVSLRRLALKEGIYKEDILSSRKKLCSTLLDVIGYYINNPRYTVTYDKELKKFNITKGI